MFGLGTLNRLEAQCSAAVPTFNVDLTGAPDSTWISPPTVRNDTCCGVTAPDRCVYFIVTLDSNANGIIMDIPEGGGCGARPTGSLFYQVNCGPQIPIGTPVCLSGPGPHNITFCKPGNNANCYQITSFPGPSASGDVVSQDGCSAELFATGYDESSLQWSSVPSNPVFESYLDCLIGCDTVTATYAPGAPAFVDFEVCGAPIGGCDTTPYCDTMRVFFVNAISVQIQPDSPTVCFGSGTTDIWAVPNGGAAPYSFNWSTLGGTPLGTTDTIAVGPGTYIVEATDTLACAFVRDTVVVTEFLSAITAFPGNDSTICGFDTVPLNGAIQAASGGIWTTGSGTFVPNRSTLNAQYIASPAEYAAGSVTLTLLTTGNGTCPADSDVVVFTLSPRPDPIPSGPSPVCEYTGGHVYATPAIAGHSYQRAVSGGNIASGQGSNSVVIFWNASGAGSLSLTQSNPDGCDTTVIFPVTIHPKPNPTITGIPPFCEWSQGNPYSVPSNPGSTYVWSVSGGTIAAGQGTPAITVDFGGAGPATVQVTETNSFGCDTTVALAFNINANPSPIISGSDTVCEFASGSGYVTPSVPGHSYSWVAYGGNIVSGQGSNAILVDWGLAGNGNVTLTQTSSNGCDTTVVFPVTILPNPVVFLQGPDSVCQFEAGISYATPGAAGHTYLWTVAGGSLVSGQGSNGIVVDWGGAGTGSVTLVETTPLGCDTTVFMDVVISPKPIPVITGSPPFCEFSTGIPYSTPAVPGHTYSWVVTGGTITSGQGTPAIQVTWGASGGGSVALTQTNPQGCDTTVAISITINPTPIPALSGPDSLCEYSSGIPYTVGSNPGNTYNWSVAGGVLVSGQGTPAILVNWGSAGTVTVLVTESSPIGCDSTVALDVVLLPKPDPVITGPQPVCAFNPTVNYAVANVPGDSYQWTVLGGNIVAGQGGNAIDVDWGAAGTGSVSLTQTTPEGYDTTVVLNLLIHPRPNPAILGVDSICAFSDGIPYQTNAVAGHTYLWTVGGGNITSGQGTNAISVDWGGAGTGLVSVLETNSFGCDTLVEWEVAILPNPATELIGPAPVCAYSVTQYSATPLPGNSYVWSVSGGTLVSGQGTASIEVAWAAPTNNGSVQLVQTTALGCDTTMAFSMQVLPAPEPVIAGPSEVCQFSQGHIYSTPFVNGTNYNWSVTGGSINSGQNTPVVTVAWNDAGVGLLSLTATTNTGCDTTIDFPVTVLPAPIALINPQDTFGCGFLEAPFSGAASPNAVDFFWDFGNGQTSTAAVPTATYTSPGTFNVTLIVSNPNGCADTGSTQVFIAPGPIASFTYDPPSPVNIETDSIEWANNSLFSDFHFWDFGDGTLDTAFIPVHQYDTLGALIIQLIAVDTFGCADTTIRPIDLIIDIDLFVPNAFTPNDDLLNDTWSVVSRNLTNFQVQIFSRWGELIYESYDPDFEWNGHHRGQPVQEGVFVWKINATGRNQRQFTRSGTVTLYR